MEVLHEPPKASSFTPLAEHQSTTPASFYSGPPVLHYYSDRSKLIVLEDEVESISAFTPLLQHATSASQPHSNAGESNGHAADTPPQAPSTQKVLDDVDVWVTSDKLFLFSPTANAGLSIPYPSISLHAIQSLPVPQPSGSSTNAPVQGQGVYMQLVSSSEEEADDEPDSISLTIIPTASGPPDTQTQTQSADDVEPDTDAIAAEDKPLQTPIMAMFTALSNYSNLHHDPVDAGDEDQDPSQSRLFQAGLAFPGASDGALPPAMPGSGGWITAENIHEFLDEEGNWIQNEGDEEEAEEGAQDDGLGPGAGTVRPREEGNGHGDGEAGDGAEDTKWQRTS